MERRVGIIWILKCGSSCMSWRSWSILALVMDVTRWLVWWMCLSDSSPHSNWATHLCMVWSEGIYSIPPLTKFWCIYVAANHSFHLCNVNLTLWNRCQFYHSTDPVPKHILYNHRVYTLGIEILTWYVEMVLILICAASAKFLGQVTNIFDQPS